MKIINNYDELVLSIRLNDTTRVEELLIYSDCRGAIISKYVESYGVVTSIHIRSATLKDSR